jgi:hypothetical protein
MCLKLNFCLDGPINLYHIKYVWLRMMTSQTYSYEAKFRHHKLNFFSKPLTTLYIWLTVAGFHTLSAIATQPTEAGGLNGGLIYVDTEGTFRPERLNQIARARELYGSLCMIGK